MAGRLWDPLLRAPLAGLPRGVRPKTYVVVARDGPGGLAHRLAVRPRHLARAAAERRKGVIREGGALLDEVSARGAPMAAAAVRSPRA